MSVFCFLGFLSDRRHGLDRDILFRVTQYDHPDLIPECSKTEKTTPLRVWGRTGTAIHEGNYALAYKIPNFKYSVVSVKQISL